MTDQDTTLTFPNVVAKRIAEAAIDRDRARQETRRNVEKLARVGRGERMGHLMELDESTLVFEEILTDQSSRWGVLHTGRLDHWRHFSLDEALLRAVELRHGGGSNSQGHIYAARVLGVTQDDDD